MSRQNESFNNCSGRKVLNLIWVIFPFSPLPGMTILKIGPRAKLFNHYAQELLFSKTRGAAKEPQRLDDISELNPNLPIKRK